jgi:hypothetical protein
VILPKNPEHPKGPALEIGQKKGSEGSEKDSFELKRIDD